MHGGCGHCARIVGSQHGLRDAAGSWKSGREIPGMFYRRKVMTMTWMRRAGGLCCAILLLSATFALAQTITATIRGTITDPSGAIVPNATVTATNVETGVTTKTRSDGAGAYNIQFLPIGQYTVSATASGFATTSRGPFTLNIDQIVEMDLALKVGAASTTVQVGGQQQPLLNTVNATLGTSISSHMLQTMPLNGLFVQAATLQVPGAVLPSMSGLSGTQAAFHQGFLSLGGTQPAEVTPSFNGNRQQTNSYILNGIDINETVNNYAGYNPSPFSIQEMRVISGNADAEFGNVSGGEMLMVTKGGTNHFHGDLFDYWENSDITANTWANNFQSVPKRRFNQHQFGFDIGGPIFRNKLFFFADYLGYRHAEGGMAIGSVPTALERQGDFSQFLAIEGTQIYDTSNGTANATPYPGNVIPSSQLTNPVAQFILGKSGLLPLPNHAPSSDELVTGGNFEGPTTQHYTNNQGDVRIDFTPSNSDNFMVFASMGDAWNIGSTNPIVLAMNKNDDFPFKMLSLGWTHTFSPSLVNNARYGASRIVARLQAVQDPTGVFGKDGDSKIGVPLPSPQKLAGFTQVQFNGDQGELSYWGTQPGAGDNITDNNFDFNDTLLWHHGNHNTKFGVQLLRYQENFIEAGNSGGQLGSFNYTGNFTAAGDSTGIDFADFLLNKATSNQISIPAGFYGQRQWRTAYYVQDDWKVRPNLTLNIGLRYSYSQPIYEVHNRMSSINLSAAYLKPDATESDWLLLAGKNGASRALYHPSYNQWQPRLGFALLASPRSVFRGGYGITSSMEGTGNGLRMTNNQPFLGRFGLNGTNPDATTGGNWVTAQEGFGTSAVFNTNYNVWAPHLQPMLVQQYNLTFQYQMSNHTAFQIGYVGENGYHIMVPEQINQWLSPMPAGCTSDTMDEPQCAPTVAPYYSVVGAEGVILATVSEGRDNYNALQASITHRESNGLEFQIHYTFAKSLSNNAGNYFGTPGVNGPDSFWQNVYDSAAEWGPSNYDARHNLVGTMVYSLPFGKGRHFGSTWNRGVDEIVGGWQLSGSAFMTSGLPETLSVSTSHCNINCNPDGQMRPNQYRAPNFSGRSIQHWWGTSPGWGTNGGCTTAGVDNGVCFFGRPADNTFGDVRPNTLRAPGMRQIDLSVFKAFKTIGEQTLTFRVDSFNAFNIASYAPPSSHIPSGIFGQIRGTNSPPRQFQLSAVYHF